VRFEKRSKGNFALFFPQGREIPDPGTLISAFLRAQPLEQKGRGGVKRFTLGNRTLVSRRYIHGGLFRILTKDIFFSEARALREMEILCFLEGNGFPVVRPMGVLVENHPFQKRLYLLTLFEEGAVDLVEYLKACGKVRRFRIAGTVAGLFRRLEELGLYHPDLHLRNMMVTKGGEVFLLDFDRAERKAVTVSEMERMFWRLDRYVEKIRRAGELRVSDGEKRFFLRAYGRLAGCDIISIMEKKAKIKGFVQKIGWFFESILYGGVK
jgi:3-deoxy-D-manno-octulosonic acid kinase